MKNGLKIIHFQKAVELFLIEKLIWRVSQHTLQPRNGLKFVYVLVTV